MEPTNWKGWKVTPWLVHVFDAIYKRMGKLGDSSPVATEAWNAVHHHLKNGAYAKVPVKGAAYEAMSVAAPESVRVNLAYLAANEPESVPAADFSEGSQEELHHGFKVFSAWTTANMNVREGPSTSHKSLRVLKTGTKVRSWEGTKGGVASPTTTGDETWVSLFGGGWLASKVGNKQYLSFEKPTVKPNELRIDKSLVASLSDNGTATATATAGLGILAAAAAAFAVMKLAKK